MAQISSELGIHVITLYKWRKAWRLQGEVVPASHKDPQGWSAIDKFTVVPETACLNATELVGYCQEWGLFIDQVARLRQAAQDANTQSLLTMADQKDLQKRPQEDQREIKRLQQELRPRTRRWRRRCLSPQKRSRPLGGGRGGLTAPEDGRKALEILDAAMAAGARAREVAALWAWASPRCSAGDGSLWAMATAWTVVKAASEFC